MQKLMGKYAAYLSAAALGSVLMTPLATASENGANNWANGALDILTGETAPPAPDGTIIVSTTVYRHNDAVTDSSGDPTTSIQDVDVDLALQSFIGVHRWGDKVSWLGDAKVATIIGGGFGNFDLSATIPTPVGGVPVDSEYTGFTDLTISPVFLGWQKGRLHYSAGVDISVPVGGYSANRIANLGFNYWTIRPVGSFSYFGKSGWEVGARVMYDFNFENPATDYKSGNALHADYVAAWRQGLWVVGASGYVFEQVEDDEVNGVPVVGRDGTIGNKGRAFATGPFVRYQFEDIGLTLKYQTELYTENRGEGDTLFLTLDYFF